jgi:hypothetical protein
MFVILTWAGVMSLSVVSTIRIGIASCGRAEWP